jgi:hypothetical protein
MGKEREMYPKQLTFGVLVLLLVVGVAGVAAPAPGVYGAQPPVWQQVNDNGFGDQDADEVSSLAAFNGYLYAGTSNPIDGARILRSPDGMTWTPVIEPGFGIAHDIAPPAILDLTTFNGRLYASTGRGDGPGQIWRALDGVNWAPMNINGFGDPDLVDITVLAEYGGMLYAGATNLITGAQVWRSSTGDNNTWTQVAPDTPGAGATVTGLAAFDGGLYAAVESDAPAQIWITYGGNWATIVDDGFGDSLTTQIGGMAVFAGFLYVGVGNKQEGAQLWRTPDGASWEPVTVPGLGDPNNEKVEMVFVFQNQLYVSVKNAQTGLELWRSIDGANWERANEDGFGDDGNSGTNWSNAATDFLGALYLGTANNAGGELWRMQPQPQQQAALYLPVVLREP